MNFYVYIHVTTMHMKKFLGHWKAPLCPFPLNTHQSYRLVLPIFKLHINGNI